MRTSEEKVREIIKYFDENYISLNNIYFKPSKDKKSIEISLENWKTNDIDYIATYDPEKEVIYTDYGEKNIEIGQFYDAYGRSIIELNELEDNDYFPVRYEIECILDTIRGLLHEEIEWANDHIAILSELKHI